MKTKRLGPILNFDKIVIHVQINPRVCRVKINGTRNYKKYNDTTWIKYF